MTWPTVSLGEVAKVERRSIQPGDIPDDTWYMGLEHIESGGRILGRQRAGDADLKSSKFQFGPQHVLYGKLRPYLAKIATPDFGGVCSTDILPVRPGALLDRSYLTHYLRQKEVVDLANSRSAGANLPRLSPSALEKIPVLMPPLNEQRRIAGILDQAGSICAKRQQSLNDLRALKGPLARHVRGGVAMRMVPLESLISDYQIGLDRRASSQSAELQFEYVKMDSITRGGELDLRQLTRVDASAGEVRKYSLEDGDLLFNTRNSRELVGKSAIYRGGPKLYNNNVMRIRLHDPFLAPYLHSFLWSVEGRRQLDSIKAGTTSVFAIYAKDLMRVKVPIPVHGDGIVERIAAGYEAVDQQIGRVAVALRADQALFASLQDRAFKGEL